MNSAFVVYEELSRSRKLLSAEVDNSDPYIIIRQEIKKALLSF